MRSFIVNPEITASMTKMVDACTRIPCWKIEIDGEIRTSMLLVDENSRMALRISHLAHTVSRGFGMLGGQLDAQRSDNRVRARHFSEEL